MRVFQKGFILTGVPFLWAAVVVGALALLIWQTDLQRQDEQNCRKLAEHTARVMLYIFDAAYCLHEGLTGSQIEWKHRFKDDITSVRTEEDEIQALKPS